jgi:hypothetical protein
MLQFRALGESCRAATGDCRNRGTRSGESMESVIEEGGSARPRPQAESRQRQSSDWLVYLAIGVLIAAAWKFSELGLFDAGDDVGYWIGVAGGTAMLLLFSYPLRKYVRALHRWGKVKWWFLAHMLLGIAGPVLILLHSTFRVGALNSAVALCSMLIVAGSGVVGRFIYLRVHRGLSGEKTSLQRLQQRAGLDQSDAASRLRFAPAVEARLKAFEQRELQPSGSWLQWLDRAFLLPLREWLAYRACRADLRAPLAQLAREGRWSRAEHAQRRRLARKLVARYLRSVVRVAQFTAWERLFALWHVAHVPFVYLMVITAVVHVIAVHAY